MTLAPAVAESAYVRSEPVLVTTVENLGTVVFVDPKPLCVTKITSEFVFECAVVWVVPSGNLIPSVPAVPATSCLAPGDVVPIPTMPPN